MQVDTPECLVRYVERALSGLFDESVRISWIN